VLPTQIAVGELVTDRVGIVFTTMLTVLVPVQPLAAVPVTVYNVVEAGVTFTVEPVKAPGFHV
jgi:hypothetical protein